jgi:CDP-diacylglycerol--glycerol-3-phosphate 3-phosphatidyltransferase
MNAIDAWAGIALPAVLAVFLAAAALTSSGARHDRVTKEGGTAFLGSGLMNMGYVWIDRAAGAASAVGMSATTLSWSSLGVGAISGALVAFGDFGLGAWALAISGMGDALDGAVARRLGQSSHAGTVLDSVLDRYVEFFFCAGLVFAFRDSIWAQLIVLAALFGGFMVTYSTAKAEALHVTPPRGWMKRPERIVWLILGTAFAAFAPWIHLSSMSVLLVAPSAIGLFANLSAARRLTSLARAR